MSAPYLRAIREHDDIDATVCFDPFHVVQLAGTALDVVRRGYWNELRERASSRDGRRFKHARWALLKRPTTCLTPTRPARRDQTCRREGVARYELREALRAIFDRAIFDPDLTPGEAAVLLDRFISWAQRSPLE